MRTKPIGTAQLATYGGLLLLHLLPAVALLTGVSQSDWVLLACVWPFQVIGSTIGLHRYFAHKSFRTSRWFQCFLALCAALALGDPIGFASKHRLHHKHSDKEGDVHSPRQGLWQCWLGSLVDYGYTEEELARHGKDLYRYPELVWLHRLRRIPAFIFAAILFVFGGFGAVAIGFALGVVSIIHLGGAVNYFCHRYGAQRFNTHDHSRNNWLLALLTLGEGWHNNHHYYQTSARAGFYWWELDVLYLLILGFEKAGLIWAVRKPPERVYQAALAQKIL